MAEVSAVPARGPLVDRFGLVDIALLVSILAFALVRTTGPMAFVAFMLQAVTFVLVLFASDVRRPLRLAGIAFVAVAGVLVVTGLVTHRLPLTRIAFFATMALAAVASPVAVGWRLLRRGGRVDSRTVTGAVALYLYVGLFFAMLLPLIGDIGGAPALAASRAIHPSDYVYFSYATLTTVGYGDVTGATVLVRMLAIAEALIGQLYLVTVIALIVGNLGRGPR